MKIKLREATGMLNKTGDTFIKIKKYKWEYGRRSCSQANKIYFLKYDIFVETNDETITIDEAKKMYGDWFLKSMDGVSEFEIYEYENMTEQLLKKVIELKSDLINSQTQWVRDEVKTPKGYSCMQYEPFQLEVHYDELDEDGEYIDLEESLIDTIEYNCGDSIKDIDKKIKAVIKEYEKETE